LYGRLAAKKKERGHEVDEKRWQNGKEGGTMEDSEGFEMGEGEFTERVDTQTETSGTLGEESKEGGTLLSK